MNKAELIKMIEEREEQIAQPKEQKYRMEKPNREEQATNGVWIDATWRKIRPPNKSNENSPLGMSSFNLHLWQV